MQLSNPLLAYHKNPKTKVVHLIVPNPIIEYPRKWTENEWTFIITSREEFIDTFYLERHPEPENLELLTINKNDFDDERKLGWVRQRDMIEVTL